MAMAVDMAIKMKIYHFMMMMRKTLNMKRMMVMTKKMLMMMAMMVDMPMIKVNSCPFLASDVGAGCLCRPADFYSGLAMAILVTTMVTL